MPKFKCRIPFYKDGAEDIVKTEIVIADNEVDAKIQVTKKFLVSDRDPNSFESTPVLRPDLITCEIPEEQRRNRVIVTA